MAQRSRWPLPSTVHPEGRKCFLVTVPDDPDHIAAFWGALYDLTKPYAWGNDTAHTALSVAAVWAELWEQIQEVDCSMSQVQFRQDVCGLQASFNGGATWNTIYDATACVTGIVDSEIQNKINDGTLQQAGGQQSPQSAPNPGSCRTYHVVLDASKQWHCPSPVGAGDTILVAGTRGGWSSSNGLSAWFCPDGEPYALGFCAGSKQHMVDDPWQGAYHMAIIGLVNGSYFDPLSATYIVPTGTPQSDFLLQANDGTLTDNSGAIEFDVTVCTAGWTHLFDFRTGLHGWTLFDTGHMHQGALGLYSTWSSGSGQDGIYISRNDVSSVQVLWARITLDRFLSGTNPEAAVRNYAQNDHVFDIHAAQQIYYGAASKTFNGFFCLVDAYDGNKQAWTGYWLTLEIAGLGTDPF